VRTRVDIPSRYPPEECLRRIGSSFEGPLGRLGFNIFSRPSWERRFVGRIEGEVVYAKVIGSVDLGLDPQTPWYLRLVFRIIPAVPSLGVARAQVIEAESGSRLVGEVVPAPAWLTGCALVLWACLLLLSVLLFVGTASPILLADVLIVVLLGILGRSAYVEVARADSENILTILTNAIQPEPSSGWWEEQPA
jgi:hypothetical protein